MDVASVEKMSNQINKYGWSFVTNTWSQVYQIWQMYQQIPWKIRFKANHNIKKNFLVNE